MKSFLTVLINLRDLFNLLSRSTKKKCYIHIFLLISVAIIEFAFSSSLIPLSEALAENISASSENFITNEDIVRFSLLFAILALLSGFGRSFIIWRNGFAASFISSEVSSAALLNDFKKNTHNFYKYEESQFTSDYSTQLQNLCSYVIRPIFDFFSSFTQVIALSILLIWYAPVLSITAIICIGISYFICILIAKPRLSKNSQRIKDEVGKTVSLLISMHRLQRELRIFNVINKKIEKFNSYANGYLQSIASNTFFASFPRFTIETIGTIFLVIYILIFLIFFPQNINQIIPQLSLFVLCASKILPSTQQIYASISCISGFKETIFLFNSKAAQNKNHTITKLASNKKLNFKGSSLIYLENIYCSIPESRKQLIDDINLQLPSIGLVSIVGKSGSGKSTLIDILLGIEQPTKGNIYLRKGKKIISNEKKYKQNYFKSFSYVSPSAYIVEGSVKENILEFKPKNINKDLIEKARFLSCCQDKDGIYLDDNAKLLSMGQKQRIALARSLISDREVLVLDEALASIDISNAKLIIERLLQNHKPKLIIQVSHRLNELEQSNMILNISREKRLVVFINDNESSSFDKYNKYIRNL